MLRLVTELARRKVLRVAVGYTAISWVMLQVAEVTFEPLQLPDWALTLVVALAILGFPIVVVLAWAFEVTPKGVVRDRRPWGGTGVPADAPPELLAPAADALESDASHAPPSPDPDSPAVAVLSFRDLSPTRDQAHICEGIAEEVTACLSHIAGVRAVGPGALADGEARQESYRALSGKLGVDTILDGSVQRQNGKLRVMTWLVTAANGEQVWSRIFDRPAGDIFLIQDEIARDVENALTLSLRLRADGSGPCNCRLEAYEYYLRGEGYLRRWCATGVAIAIELFEKAIAIDEGCHRAWASLAMAHALQALYWDPDPAHVTRADEASRRALSIAPERVETRVARAMTLAAQGHRDESFAELERAHALAPNSFEANYYHARLLVHAGHFEKAATMFEAAEKARPQDYKAPILLRQVYRALGDGERAAEAAARGVDRAIATLEREPDDACAMHLAVTCLAQIGDRERMHHYATRSLEITRRSPEALYNVACGHALLGESERALDLLEEAAPAGRWIGDWMLHDTDLASLRDEPRFRRLVALSSSAPDNPPDCPPRRGRLRTPDASPGPTGFGRRSTDRPPARPTNGGRPRT